MDAQFPAELALRADGLLREFNRAGILSPADVHVATTLGALAGAEDERVLLALALAVRAPRLGHVHVDLAAVARTAVAEAAADAWLTARGNAAAAVRPEPPDARLAWPDPDVWVRLLAAQRQLVATDGSSQAPLQLDGTHLYLERYWRAEQELAAALRALAQAPPRTLDVERLQAGLERCFPDPADAPQALAAASISLYGLSVIAGGPGTGKTTTVAAALALLLEQDPGQIVALCAPTGRAAAALEQAVHGFTAPAPLGEQACSALQALHAATIHRLLGAGRGALGVSHSPLHSAFLHGPDNRLPHDLVVVDEASMVPLWMMHALLRAMRPGARLVLVGDPDQLTAVEAGAVLHDIVGPAVQRDHPQAAAARRSQLLQQAKQPAAGRLTRSFGAGIVTLCRGHRFGAAIGRLADAVRGGDADAAITALEATPAALNWISDGGERSALLRELSREAHRAVRAAAARGDGAAALAALGRFRVLCAHREGRYGVTRWRSLVERWIRESDPRLPRRVEPRAHPGFQIGEPLLITRNDHELRLHNGDAGVVVGDPSTGALRAVFARDGGLVALAPSRLEAVEPLYAMTIHRSQGSQFDAAAVVLPAPGSSILTRQLLYTAITRAKERLILIGSEASLRAAIARPVTRASGLERLLWE